ncbi:MAG: helix-turn-helix domain-containing protein [Castellaniella sp.]|nr:helix-turn-helix domain-containing protein [Castellaniella sp.]
MKTLAERLSEALTKTGHTKADLARACGVAAPSVNDWFSGKTKSLKGSSLIRASNFLGVRSLWLAEGKGPRTNDEAHSAVVEPTADSADLWPFRLVSKQDYDRLTTDEQRDLDKTVARFIAGCLAGR